MLNKSFVCDRFQVLVMAPNVSIKEAKSLICLFVVMSICVDHERYFSAEALSRATLCRIYS